MIKLIALWWKFANAEKRCDLLTEIGSYWVGRNTWYVHPGMTREEKRYYGQDE